MFVKEVSGIAACASSRANLLPTSSAAAAPCTSSRRRHAHPVVISASKGSACALERTGVSKIDVRGSSRRGRVQAQAREAEEVVGTSDASSTSSTSPEGGREDGQANFDGQTNSSEQSNKQAADGSKKPPKRYGTPQASWALLLLGASYVHASATGFVLPALLPDVAADLDLSDTQSASLTFAFTLTYSLLIIPIGAVTDRVDRPLFLSGSILLWSCATLLTANASNYATLLLSRVVYAAGYAAQNPIAFGMIPELFPRRRSSAMGIYNLAIHLGRGVSFGGGALLGNPHHGPSADADAAVAAVVPADAAPVDLSTAVDASSLLASAAAADDDDDDQGEGEFRLGSWLGLEGGPNPIERSLYTLPVDSLVDISQLSMMGLTVLYIVGDQLVLTANIADGGLSNTAAAAAAAVSLRGLSWRDVITWFAVPGLILAPLLALTVQDPGRSSSGSRTARRRTRAKVGRLKRKAQEAVVEINAEITLSKGRLGALTARAKEIQLQVETVVARRLTVAASIEYIREEARWDALRAREQALSSDDASASWGGDGASSAAHGGEEYEQTLAAAEAELAALLQTEILAREAVATEKLGVLEEQETLRSLRHKLALKQVAVLKALQAPAVFPPSGAPASRLDTIRALPKAVGSWFTTRLRLKKRYEESEDEVGKETGVLQTVKQVVASKSWQNVTGGAVMMDVGAWTLIAFQSSFFERVHHLTTNVSSPLLAIAIPMGGVTGGVLSSLIIDKFSSRYPLLRRYLIAGGTLAAGPVFAASLLAPDWHWSMLLLIPGYALAEVWRAPTAGMIRAAGPKSAPGTSTATHLASRNLAAGLGPLAAAIISQKVGGLQYALLLTPLCYVIGSALFWRGDKLLAEKAMAEKAGEWAKKEAAIQAARAAAATTRAREEAGGAAAGAPSSLHQAASMASGERPPAAADRGDA